MQKQLWESQLFSIKSDIEEICKNVKQCPFLKIVEIYVIYVSRIYYNYFKISW